MKTLYLDTFSGISGDMFIGALLDLGVDFDRFEQELAKLGLTGFHLHISRQHRSQIAGTKFDVHLEEDHPHHHDDDGVHVHHDEHEHVHPHVHRHEDHSPLAHRPPAGAAHEHGHEAHHDHEREQKHGRTFSEIKRLISGSQLSDWVKQKSIAIFQRLAAAEGKIHGQPTDEVHFHEVGAVDSIVDIVGACVALELLGQPRVLAAPVVEGTGWVHCAHGRFPIPAPATLEILGARGVPITQCAEPAELVTPTGAALLAELAESFGPMRDFVPGKIGYGLGKRENETRPNVLRVMLGDSSASTVAHDWEADTICSLQTNLDDINAEILGRFVEQALGAGALDVFYTPIQMKKNRPGVLLTVLCNVSEADKFTELILRETSTFGVRRMTADRRKLRREVVTAKTAFGDVLVKIGKLDGKVVQVAPEFESCKAVADRARVPLKQIYEAAGKAL